MTPNDPRPPFAQVADDLRAAIGRGDYAPGERLPSGRALANEYGVALMTMQRALSTLADEGLLALHRNRGAFVRSPDAQKQPAPSLADLAQQVADLRATLRSVDDRLSRIESRASEET